MSFLTFLVNYRGEILSRTLEHLLLVAAAMLAAVLVGIPLGIALVRRQNLRRWFIIRLNTIGFVLLAFTLQFVKRLLMLFIAEVRIPLNFGFLGITFRIVKRLIVLDRRAYSLGDGEVPGIILLLVGGRRRLIPVPLIYFRIVGGRLLSILRRSVRSHNGTDDQRRPQHN